MKWKIVLLFFTLLLFGGVNGQAVKVTYNLYRNPEIKKVTEEGIVITLRTDRDDPVKRPDARLMLICYNGISSYEPFLSQQEARAKESIDPSMRNPQFSSSIFKQTPANRIITAEKIMGEHFIVSENFRDYGWKITGEKKEIAYYECIKAVDATGKITAWYCPDLAINDGPGFYTGLPGLILMVKTDKEEIVAHEIEEDYMLTRKLVIPTEGKTMDRKDFDKYKMDRMEQEGIMDEYSGMRVKTIEGGSGTEQNTPANTGGSRPKSTVLKGR